MAEQADVVALDAREGFWAGPPGPEHLVLLLSEAPECGWEEGDGGNEARKGSNLCCSAGQHVWLLGGPGRKTGYDAHLFHTQT